VPFRILALLVLVAVQAAAPARVHGAPLDLGPAPVTSPRMGGATCGGWHAPSGGGVEARPGSGRGAPRRRR
jgi:hypothetical protein